MRREEATSHLSGQLSPEGGELVGVEGPGPPLLLPTPSPRECFIC